jgi:hypothetical protein|tara:strand:+ start:2123 stop:2245 length:123 start_codon:yes stop_codon:yes gene_type:complete
MVLFKTVFVDRAKGSSRRAAAEDVEEEDAGVQIGGSFDFE